MSIHLVCPGCRKKLVLPDTSAGKLGRCPRCKALFNVPTSVLPEPAYSSAPLPQPVLSESSPPSRLTHPQKLGFAVVAASVLAVAGFFVVRSLPSKEAERGDKSQAVADASAKTKSPAPPSDSKSKANTDGPAREQRLEEDTGRKPPRVTTDAPAAPLALNPPKFPPRRKPPASAPPKAEPPRTETEPSAPQEAVPPAPRPRTRPAAKEPTSPKPARVRLAAYAKRFESIDQHALEAPAEAERSIAALAAYLTKPARDDVEKVRAIYRWTTDRIAYNLPAFLTRRFPDCSVANVLKTRLTVCEGYANVVAALCQEAGVPVVKVRGHLKGYGYREGEKPASNHVWNAVQLGDGWALLDATVGAGVVGTDQKWAKQFNASAFLTPPDQFIFNHLPEDPHWQLLDPAAAEEEYQRWPLIDPLLFRLGVSAKDVRAKASEPRFRGFVKAFLGSDVVKLRKAPLQAHLVAGQIYEFEIESATALNLAAHNNGQLHPFTKRGNVFTVKILAPPGTLRIMAQLPDKGKQYWGLVEYQVEAGTATGP